MKRLLAASDQAARPAFGFDWVATYLPRYLKQAPSRLHRELVADLAQLLTLRGQKRNYIAPRGSAKTTWISKVYPMFTALEGIEPLTLLLADTGQQAKKYLDAIKRHIESNPTIRRDYPASAGRGPIWKSDHIRLRNGCEIVARGAGGRVLGITSDDRRPTLVVVDDGNERGDAYSPTKRERKIDWMIRDVLPVGEPGTNFIAAGTPIHREAIVCHLRDAGWQTRSYRAMYKEPVREDLWQQWKRSLLNLSDPARIDTAAAFYATSKAEMDRGSEMLWPERLTLYDVMVYRTQNGESAYQSEYTDDPGTPAGAEWPSTHFDRPGFWFDDWPQCELKVIALDPSKGSDSKSGDFQAHALIGLCYGDLLIDCVLKHEPPEEMCLRTIELAREFGRDGKPVDSIVLEDNNTLGLLDVAIREATRKTGVLLPWQCLTNTGHKSFRIRTVSPYLSTKRVRVRNTAGGRMLVQQWREFPFGKNDDGPDAVATGIRRMEILTGGGR